MKEGNRYMFLALEIHSNRRVELKLHVSVGSKQLEGGPSESPKKSIWHLG